MTRPASNLRFTLCVLAAAVLLGVILFPDVLNGYLRPEVAEQLKLAAAAVRASGHSMAVFCVILALGALMPIDRAGWKKQRHALRDGDLLMLGLLVLALSGAAAHYLAVDQWKNLASLSHIALALATAGIMAHLLRRVGSTRGRQRRGSSRTSRYLSTRPR